MSKTKSTKRNDDRFEVSKTVLFVDTFMQRFIKVGGIGVIAAVCGIFVFVFVQILPLFRGAEIEEIASIEIPSNEYLILGVDQWSELPFVVDRDKNIHFIDLTSNDSIETVRADLPADTPITAVGYNQLDQTLTYGLADGRFKVVKIKYVQKFSDNVRKITQSLEDGKLYPIGRPGFPVKTIDYADSGNRKLAAALQDVDGQIEVHAVTLKQKQTLLGSGKIKVNKTFNLTDKIEGSPAILRVSTQANVLLVATSDGRVFYFRVKANECSLMQVFQPFKDLDNPAIHSMNFLFGGVSIVLSSTTGENRIFSLFVPEKGSSRLFSQTKSFPSLPGPEDVYASSLRNKAFLIGSGNFISLRYATTEAVRWQRELDYALNHVVLSSKYDKILGLDANNSLRVFKLKDPHAKGGFAAYFKKQWYEGASHPKYEWQSTGGTDDYEPKLSMIPLIIGTLKGTFYAMLFATPIALTAALYTSQFLSWKVRLFVKPTMEIMASLPSVVLGFLAALWLAPIVEVHLVFIFLLLFLLPVSAMVFGTIWSRVPIRYRQYLTLGNEFFILSVIIIITTTICWWITPHIEKQFFVVLDPVAGTSVTDFRMWWRQTTHLPFEQRNALVVGFAMGFAVIPIIFSIAEESLSNVPKTLSSGALALGASRWQTAIRIVLPTASAGIFSAVMIGLGRAVGETMIVLMATGNTPVMDFNIFTGMRTLSANIAVELPEAPHNGTLYRTLFLGALVLFMFTFLLNTLAEVLRQHLREKYKTV